MKNKGFTLIELLAVIVILAIIALIATPIILGIINDSKKQSEDRSAELYLDAAKKAIARYQANNPDKDFSNVTSCDIGTNEIVCGEYHIPVEISGQAPSGGTILLSKGNIVSGTEIDYGTENNKKTYSYTNGKLALKEAPEPTDASCFTYTTEKVTSFDINYNNCNNVLPTLMQSFGVTLSSEQLENSCTGADGADVRFPISEILAVPNYRQILVQYGVIDSNSLVVDETNEAIITGYTCNERDVVIPSSIDGKAVTRIAMQSFTNKNLTSVVIPNGVTIVGNSAFSQNQLESVTIPNSVTTLRAWAFYENQLKSVTIPNSVTSIGAIAFNGNKLESVTIPNSVTTIGVSAFQDNQIASLTIPNSVTTIGDNAFQDNQIASLTIPNSVTAIGIGAFSLNQLTEVTIPNSVTTIGDYAFSSNGLTSLTLGNSVTTIGNNAFFINQLTSLTIPNSVTTIGADAFRGNQLTSVVIPSSVTTIGNNAFGCGEYPYNADLERIYGPNAITSVTLVGRNSIEDISNHGSNIFCWVSGKSDANINE